jgi:methylenetetrahydrofolate reductase (NADPH)
VSIGINVSPAPHMKPDIQPKDAQELWGTPGSPEDISALFARFCRGDLSKLPWSSQPPASETSVIQDKLSRMNEMGYWTINSQPAVDGVRSDDKVHGWGPPGGYVYQKVRIPRRPRL